MTESIHYLTVSKLWFYKSPLDDVDDDLFSGLGDIALIFELDNKKTQIQRQRYTFWAALGDIGGFYDGLNLLISIFLAPLSSALFFNDLVKGSVFTKKSSKSLKATRKQAAFSI